MIISTYQSLAKVVLPIGAIKQLAQPAVGAGDVLKQILLTNGQGSGNAVSPRYNWGICPGPEGIIYMVVGSNAGGGSAIVEIKSVPAAGQPNFRLVAGLPGSAGTTNGTGTAARFSTFVSGIAYANGKLYIADTSNQKIRIMDTATYAVSDFAGTGSSAQTDGTGASAAFVSPLGLVVDPLGQNLYVSQRNGSGTSSFRKVTLPGAVVTTPTGQTHASVNTRTDTITISQDGLHIWYTDSEQTSAASSFLYRYTLASSTRVEISDSAGNSGTDQTPSGIFAIGATTASIVKFGSSGWTTLCCDPQDPAACYFFDNANTGGSSASNRIHRIRLLPNATTPTHFEIVPFAFAGGSTANTTEGIGAAGPQVGTTQSFLASVAMGRNLLFADLGAATEARIISVDTETAMCAFVSTPATTGGAIYNGTTYRAGYVDLYALPSGDTSPQAYKRFVSREAVALGARVKIDLNSCLGPGETLYAQAQNTPIWCEVAGLAFEE